MKKRRRISGLLNRVCILSLVLRFTASAQQVTVNATVDSNNVSIGSWMILDVDVKHPADVLVRWQPLRDTLDGFDIIRVDSIPPVMSDGMVVEKKKIVLAKYEAGDFTIPPVAFAFRGQRDSLAQYVSTNPIPIRVRTIAIDTTQSIKDLKPPLRVPLTVSEILLYVGIGLVLIGIVYAVYYYRKKKMKAMLNVPEEKPSIPAHIVAIQKLKELESRRIWQSGDSKRFYSEATGILREYFEHRYGIMALEMTTEEVLAQLKIFKLETDVADSIYRFLAEADLVKFAKYMPIPSENEMVIPTALIIVEKTKPVQTIPLGEPVETVQVEQHV